MSNYSKDARVVVFAIFSIVFLAFLSFRYYKRSQETTDNAVIKCEIVDVVPEISGVIEDLRFSDNTAVEQGDLLVRIRDDVLRSSLSVMEAEYVVQQSEVDVIKREIDVGELNLRYNERQFRRVTLLHGTKSVTEKDLDDAERLFRTSVVEVEALKSRLAIQLSKLDLASAKIGQAKVALGQTKILAPSSGLITNRRVSVGEHMQSGQTVASITSCHRDIWVEANFKETQIARMAKGRQVDIHVDAYPDRIFNGVVDSISSGSGATFSVLPPENATGNFTKVVQRFPVKIRFSEADARELRMGMSAVVSVDVAASL